MTAQLALKRISHMFKAAEAINCVTSVEQSDLPTSPSQLLDIIAITTGNRSLWV
jgi:hypothetical protein